MLKITLEKSELDYLLSSELDDHLIKSIKNGSNQNYKTVQLSLEKGEAESILDFLGDELANKGLQRNDEPNSFGLMIENIIDRFSREIYK